MKNNFREDFKWMMENYFYDGDLARTVGICSMTALAYGILGLITKILTTYNFGMIK